MIQYMDVPVREDGIWQSENIVYAQQIHGGRGWHGHVRKLHLTLIRPYDEKKRQPCILWICGGGWRHEEYNAYVPQLAWLAKRGYTVACVEYTCNELRFPAQIEQIKAAIRFLKAHAEQFQIDRERFGIMGGSAGAHLAAMIGVTNHVPEYDAGDYLEESSSVQAVCTWYLPADLSADQDPEAEYTQKLLLGYAIKDKPEEGKKACPALLADKNTVPFLMFHGTDDKRVPYEQSVKMHEALERCKVPAELYLINGAGHGAPEFLQEPVCNRIGEFFDRWLKKSEK